MSLTMKRSRPNPRHMDQHMDDDELKPSHPLKEGLSYRAFAVAPDLNDPGTWLAPHHTRSTPTAGKMAPGQEQAIDWQKIEECVHMLSRQGVEGRRIKASPETLVAIARHLARHYAEEGKPLPDALAVLI
jgi:hypothetical protein